MENASSLEIAVFAWEVVIFSLGIQETWLF